MAPAQPGLYFGCILILFRNDTVHSLFSSGETVWLHFSLLLVVAWDEEGNWTQFSFYATRTATAACYLVSCPAWSRGMRRNKEQERLRDEWVEDRREREKGGAIESDGANAVSKMTVSVKQRPRERTREHDWANVPVLKMTVARQEKAGVLNVSNVSFSFCKWRVPI